MTPLEKNLSAQIRQTGPLALADYMARALGDPQYGYYMTQNPFGVRGDFVTAPEISQIFGELLGAWCVDYWQRLGAPSPFILLELGPGRGTLMQDLLRVGAHNPAFIQAAHIYFFESSPLLRTQQKQRIPHVQFCDDINKLPALPLICIANEFFDALPIRQYRKTAQGWEERCVACNADGLYFTYQPCAAPDTDVLPAAKPGDIVETTMVANHMIDILATHISTHNGASLIIDYGYTRLACGDSLQAMHAHNYVHPLSTPGKIDMTAHVNFAALSHYAKVKGAYAYPVISQGAFLHNLGIGPRARILAQNNPEQSTDIALQKHRLTAPEAMGDLFKVLCITPSHMIEPAGFSPNQ